MKIEIKHRFNSSVLFSTETANLKLAIKAAVRQGANLKGADLRGAYLEGAYLKGVDLKGPKEDFFKVLDTSPNEVAGLRQAMINGKINGNQYEGECACLVGTIAKISNCKFNNMSNLKPNSDRPAEIWFLMFRPGHTPENHAGMKKTLGWLDEWVKKNKKLLETT